MGKVAAIALVAFSISAAYYTLNRQEQSLKTEARISDYQYEVLAREAALDGLAIAKQKLADSFMPQQFSGLADAAAYEVDVSVTSDLATVSTVGLVQATNGLPLEYRINAVYRVATGVVGSAPKFLRYALASEEDLVLGGGVRTEVHAAGLEGAQLNANMHTNGNLQINGKNTRVEGFGTYTTFASSNPADALHDTFQPSYWSAEVESVYQVSEELDFPPFDASLWIENVDHHGYTVTDIEGDFDLGGNMTFGTQDSPSVVRVRGDLSANSSSEINGYVMFVVEGDVNLAGSVIVGDSGSAERNESSIAMYANGTVRMTGSIEVAAQIYSNDDVHISGTPTIYGSIATRGAAKVTGSPTIFYRPPSSALSANFGTAESHLELVAYSEW